MTTPTRDRLSRMPHVVCGLLWLLIVVVVCRHRADPMHPDPYPALTFQDFRDTVWYPWRYALQGGNPWDTSAYLAWAPSGVQVFPLYVPIYWPVAAVLGALPYRIAVALWCLVMFAAIAYAAAATARAVGGGSRRRLLAAGVVLGLLLLTRPGRMAWVQGNWQMVVVGGATMAFLGSSRASRVLGLLLVAVKPQCALPVWVGVLLLDRWREVARAALWTVFLVAPVLVVCVRRWGLGAFAATLRKNASSGWGPADAPSSPRATQIDVDGTWEHIGIHVSSVVGVLAAVVIVMVTAALVRKGRTVVGPVVTAAIGGLLAGLVALPNMLYALCLLVPFGTVAAWRLGGAGDGARAPRVLCLASLVLVLAPFGTSARLVDLASMSQNRGNWLNGVALEVSALAWVLSLALALHRSHPSATANSRTFAD